MKARWIDLGECEAADYHATYAGVAEAMRPEDNPVVVWGMPATHFCLGQHQSAAAELIEQSHIPVIRRPLGGGGVWLDRNQPCVVMVAPRNFFPVRPEAWYAHALAPVLQVYREMSWPVKLVRQDIWLDDKKLGGSGAASIAQAGLVGTSFLLKFPAAEFARLIDTPSDGFRLWLDEALLNSVTSWAEHASVPDPAWLSLVYRRAAAGIFGWRWEQSLLRDDEHAAVDDYRSELLPDGDRRARQIPYGIKIRARHYLTERDFDGASLRVLTRDRTVARLALSAVPQLPERLFADEVATQPVLSAALRTYLPADKAELWAQRILATAYFEEA